MKDLADKALKELENNSPKIYPSRQIKNYQHWLKNIQDWNISRQLWWGHRIPAYYCGGKEEIIDKDGNLTEIIGKKYAGCGKIIVSPTPITKCPHCGSLNIEQDSDIFDTWFSSTQWPFTILGGTETDEFSTYYPFSLMETARDILFPWVARMVIMGLFKTGRVPFANVYLHGIVLDREGKKQSKSKGNGIDPKELIERYSADALRMAVLIGIAPDQDYRLYDEKVKGYRNFINKIWNASRFVLLNTDKLSLEEKQRLSILSKNTTHKNIKVLDKKINEIKNYLDQYKIGKAGEEIYDFFWHTFCDIWLEESKKDLNTEEIAYLISSLEKLLVVIHPFAPFITESIWQILKSEHYIDNKSESIMYTSWPTE